MQIQRLVDLPEHIKVVFFDMDHTIINNDCDVSWKDYLVSRGKAGFWDRLQGKKFYRQYLRGELNIEKFMNFQLKQFRDKSREEMEPLVREHFEIFVQPKIYPGMREYISYLKARNVLTVLLTATNEVIAFPLLEYLGMHDLIGTKLEIIKGKYTGRFHEPYCGGEGKIFYIQEYLEDLKIDMGEVSYWGDSINDIPVLEKVGFAVACNPANGLRDLAMEKQWLIVDLNFEQNVN